MEKQEASNILSIRDLYVEYTSDGKVIHAVNGVSFDMKSGETLGLVGETGAGKTTIAKAILRILPDMSSKIKGGEVWFDGEDLLRLPEEKMRRIRGARISMVFSDPMTALNPTMKVGKQVAGVIALHNPELSKAAVTKKAVEMLEMVGITEDRYNEYPHQFSGGMKQRVIIAMALACSPDLLLADEPTTALDVTIQAQVLEMMRALKQAKNTSMLLITHDLGIVAENCDKVGIIYAGEIIEFGSLREIFKNPQHPYTIGLFGTIPDMESDDEWLHPIDGLPPDPSCLPEGCRFSPRCPHASEECQKGHVEMVRLNEEHSCRCLKVPSRDEKER